MTFTVATKMVEMECGECGVVYALTKAFVEERGEDHKTWRCPWGHRRYFPQKSREEELREQLEREQQRRREAYTRALHAEDQKRAAEHELRATRGAARKVAQRIQAGVCPCCNRSFKNLSRHMETKHPDWAGAAYRRLTDSDVWHMEETCRWWPGEERAYEEKFAIRPPGRVCRDCVGKVDP